MSEIISTWVLGICAVSLITAAASAAVGEDRQAGVLRLIGAAATVWILFAPLKADGVNWSQEFAAFQNTLIETEALHEMTQQAQEMAAQRIEAYIEQEAEQNGIICTVQAACNYTEGAFYLEFCQITYETPLQEQERMAFETKIAQALGVDKESIVGR